MENITYQLETAKATLRGTMAAINSGELEKWEIKERNAVRRECVANIRKWLVIKNEFLNG